MRKVDVFGKKRHMLKPIYIFVLSFLVIIAARYGIFYLQDLQVDTLKKEESELRLMIDEFLNYQQIEYYKIDDILIFLPNTYESNLIDVEIETIKVKHGLHLSSQYQFTQELVLQTPLNQSLPGTIRFVKISIQFQGDSLEHAFEFIDDIIKLDRIYYLSALNVHIIDEDFILVSVILYTFYNHVDLSE